MDVFTKKKRSEVMSKIKGKNNKETELEFAKILRKSKRRGWLRGQNIYGKPDFVFKKERIAIFIDGCFWHKCPIHFKMPKSNNEFWNTKINANVKRDKKVNTILKKEGWIVLRFWEHELKKSIDNCIIKLDNVFK
jgi:DNA mismatch endonuclease (patch repair protein)